MRHSDGVTAQERTTAHAYARARLIELAPPIQTTRTCIYMAASERDKAVKLSQLSLQQLDRFKTQLNEVRSARAWSGKPSFFETQ